MITTLALLTACGTNSLDVNVDGDYTAVAKSVTEGSTDAIALLAFLNDPATSMTVLDDEVPLDKRAAGNLIAHRDGGDATVGTSDDDEFDSIAEVDAVRWVGTKTIEKLAAYALDQGYGLEDYDILGTWDGVTFTVAEAAATVAFVNDASETMLDDEVPLNRRAVNSIMDARPLETVEQLSGLYYVGNSAMELLLDGAYNLGDDSWLDEDEEEEEEGCEPTLTELENSDAEDLTELLALATTSDAPWAEILSFEGSGCDDWTSPGDNLTRAWYDEAFVWDWSDITSLLEVGEWTPGASAFGDMLDTALIVIDENVDDGDWDPADAQELYDSRFETADSLMLMASEDPSIFMEQHIYIDMVECSQEAVVMMDTVDGTLIIIHEESHC